MIKCVSTRRFLTIVAIFLLGDFRIALAQSSSDLQVLAPATSRPAQVEAVAPTASQPGILKLDNASASTPIGTYLGGTHLFASCPYQSGCITTGNSDQTQNDLYTFLMRTTKQFTNRNEWPVEIDAYSNLSGTYLPFNVTVVAGANAGPVWAGDFNTVMLPGNAETFNPGVEIDVTNNSGKRCANGLICQAISIMGGGNTENTAGVSIGTSNMSNVFSYVYPIWIQTGAIGTNNYGYEGELADIEDDSSAAVGIDFGGDHVASHSTALIRDPTSGAVGLLFTGKKTGAQADLAGTGAQGINIHGTYGNQGIADSSMAPFGIQLGGTYSTAGLLINGSTTNAIAINGNKNACLNGINNCFYYDTSTQKLKYKNGSGTVVFSIDESGHAIFLNGSSTGTP